MTPFRVVVADDSDAYRSALCDFLQHFPDLTVIAAAQNGEEAIQLVESLAPDLLILDIQMPKMSGWDVLHHLETAESSVRILVLSSHAAGRARDRAFKAGAVAYVPKGNIQLLVDTLRKLLDAPDST
jgi:DNA-binding NarL/FixJ family response regulator